MLRICIMHRVLREQVLAGLSEVQVDFVQSAGTEDQRVLLRQVSLARRNNYYY